MEFFRPFKKLAVTSNGRAGGAAPQPPAVEGAELGEVVASILGAVAAASRSVDAASAELAKIYWKDPVLRSLPLPAFSIPEVTVHMKFAVVRIDAPESATAFPAMRVVVDAASLGKLPSHLVSEMQFKVTPQAVRTYQTDSGEVRLNSA